MARTKKLWFIWRCYKCDRRHKDYVRGFIYCRLGAYIKIRCDKCGKYNKINIYVKIEESRKEEPE